MLASWELLLLTPQTTWRLGDGDGDDDRVDVLVDGRVVDVLVDVNGDAGVAMPGRDRQLLKPSS